jgi:hypothetical protein
MKKSLLFSAVLAGLMLGSCSSSDDIAGSNTGFNETGKGYINISLNLPTQGKNVSRTANDDTADGVADEYKVNDAALLLFAGANENDAVFQGAYDLNGFKKNDINNNVQISTQLTKVQEISSISASGNIYAFVLVNKGSNFSVGTDHTIKVNGSSFTGNFSDFSKLEVDGAFVKDNLMMTNVPVVTKPGTAPFDNATVLADVTKSIFKTEAEAKANPAADIFVERVASKVTLGMTGSGTSTETLSADGATAKNFKYTLEGWNLANVNKSSYLVRQYDNSWKDLKSDGYDFLTGADKSAFAANPYRFAGINLIKTTVSSDPAANKYRTYWGKDINYNTVEAPFATDPTVGDEDLTLGKDASTYCYENTFDVAHQDVRNTTCAIVKMKITPDSYSGTTFYIINGSKDVVYSLVSAKTKVGNQFLAENTESSLKTKYFSTVSEDGKITVSDVDFSDNAGKVTFNKLVLTFTPTATGGTTSTADVTDAAVLTALANNIKVVEYKDGYSYYNILIKHFGDELTPWNPSTKTSGISYPTPNEANWLGRYGVLRNNWYDLDITGVSRLGAATPEELDVKKDPTPDDNLKSYISVKINVLSWAKRTQKAILGQ